MKKLFRSGVARLRALGMLEGISLLILVFIAVPVKYVGNDPRMVQLVGPIHGALFVLYVVAAIQVAIELKWSFMQTLWRVFVATFIPFGTFYVDSKFLRNRDQERNG